MGLKERLETVIRELPGQVGMVVTEGLQKPLFMWQENEVFPAASLIKLFVLWELYRRADYGELDLSERVMLRSVDKVPGFGVLKDLEDGLQPSLRDLATLMVIQSDNVATNILINRLSMNAINEMARGLGAENSVLSRHMMDAQARAKGLDNFTTPMDIARFLLNCIFGEGLSETGRAEVIDVLRRQQCNNKLPQGFPVGTVFAHKTGDLPGIEHDAGILTTASGPIIVVVMTRDLADNATGVAFHHKVATIMWDEIVTRQRLD